MCGIVWVKRGKGFPANKAIIKRFHQQRGRGTEGFGYVAVKDGKVVAVEKSTDEKDILEKLKNEDAEEILFHHRFPTGGTDNYKELAHPMVIDDINLEYKYLLVHNGVITNADFLKKKHEDLGFVYKTEHRIEKSEITEVYFGEKLVDVLSPSHKVVVKYNDSEALAYEFALVIEGYKDTIESYGGAAIICYQVDKKTNDVIKMYYGSNLGRPLVLESIKKKKSKKAGRINPSDVVSIKSTGNGRDLIPNYLYYSDYQTEDRNIVSYPFSIGNCYTAPKDKVRSVYNVDQKRKEETETKRIGFGRSEDVEMDVKQIANKVHVQGKRSRPDFIDRLTYGLDNDNYYDEDQTQYLVEEAIEKQVTEHEIKGLVRKLDNIADELAEAKAEYTSALDSLFEGGEYHIEKSDDVALYEVEVKRLTNIYTDLIEKLEELGHDTYQHPNFVS